MYIQLTGNIPHTIGRLKKANFLHYGIISYQENLKDFVKCYNPENRFKRGETECFKKFSYKEIIARDKTSLDIIWLKDDSLTDLDNLPDPDVLAIEIIENVESALDGFKAMVEMLKYENR